MSLWLTLTRHDAAQIEELLEHPEGPSAGRERLRLAWNDVVFEDDEDGTAYPRVIEETSEVRRNWDALHVLLTGAESFDEDGELLTCAPAPARDVVMGGLVLAERGGNQGRLYNPLLLMPDQVRAVHSFLQGLDAPTLIACRGDLLRKATFYSFSTDIPQPDGTLRTESVVEDGSLAAGVDIVRGFYARAAAAGNAVIKEVS
ncbi:DUF1877 family protein [Streptomyces sp. NBC_00306]|uniref:DUF1877 family protein n=1 Tax=Streptomyces sp. NBC_00306 TaxID=2975708 RepID=UPI002E27CE62|nr:DUF1877 family protein [Streptomyces sp. NBC_00306]